MNVWLLKLDSIIHYRVRGVPLWVIGICGVAGVLVDTDHPITYWITGKATRADHIPLAIISCLILCGVSACIGGLYCKLVLKGDNGVLKLLKVQIISWLFIIAIVVLGFWLFKLI